MPDGILCILMIAAFAACMSFAVLLKYLGGEPSWAMPVFLILLAASTIYRVFRD